jgi:hypothetical protein
MEKRIVGTWGADLTDEEYAAALAALGALESTGTHQYPASGDPTEIAGYLDREFDRGKRCVGWRQALNVAMIDTPDAWMPAVHKNAKALALGWQAYLSRSGHPRHLPRMSLSTKWMTRPDHFSFRELVGWLTSRDLLASLVIENGEVTPPRTQWRLPLVVGIPAESDIYGALTEARTSWLTRLTRVVRVGEARDACDLLILPTGYADQLAGIARLRLRASFIICLEDPVPPEQVGASIYEGLRQTIQAAGLALVGKQPEFPKWYKGLIRNVCHDIPADGAVWLTNKIMEGLLPLIVGVPCAIDTLRILGLAERLDSLQRATIPKMFRKLKGGSLAEMVITGVFESEDGDTSSMKPAVEAQESDIERKQVQRRVQAGAIRLSGQPEPVKTIEADAPSLFWVQIGQKKDAASAEQPFPETGLDYRTGPIAGAVQIELAGVAVEAVDTRGKDLDHRDCIPLATPIADRLLAPESMEIVGVANAPIQIPRIGDSSAAWFVVRPANDLKRTQGRIAIIVGNRIVQTVHLIAPVGTGPGQGQAMTLKAESPVHPRLDDLEDRREFDVALLSAEDLGNRLRLTVSCGGRSKAVELNGVSEPISSIRRAIHELARRNVDVLQLNAEAARVPMLSLASQGVLLYQDLQKQLGDMLDKVGRVQLVCRGNSFFPIEYLYDGPPPDLNAEVCENSAKALPVGACGNCPNVKSKAHVCPLHFWGLQKVIERHGDSKRGEPADTIPPSASRASFGAPVPALLAASDRAYQYDNGPLQRQELEDALTRLTGVSPPLVQTWPAWKDHVKTMNPRLLVLLPHSDKVPVDVEVLEIGKGGLLAKHEIDGELVGDKQKLQLLLLLGCATANVTTNFAPYPQLFRDAGAEIVVAPLAPILGADAVPIAKKIAVLLGELGSSPAREAALGELLRQVRREMLAEGHPGALGLVAFGDADWVFGG